MTSQLLSGGAGEAEEPLGGETEGGGGRDRGEAVQRHGPDLAALPEPGVAQHHGQGQGEAGAGHQGPGRVLVRDTQHYLTH